MIVNNEPPLEIEVQDDGRVRIGDTLLGLEDSKKFVNQTVPSGPIFWSDRGFFTDDFIWRTYRVGSFRGSNLRGRFVLFPVTAPPSGVPVPEGDVVERLIERYIEVDLRGRRPEEARLREYGYAVWALMGDLLYPGRTREVVAQEYEVPLEAVDAVWNYYLRHRVALDRRLAENRAA